MLMKPVAVWATMVCASLERHGSRAMRQEGQTLVLGALGSKRAGLECSCCAP